MCTPCRDDKVAHPNCIHLAYLCTQFVVVVVVFVCAHCCYFVFDWAGELFLLPFNPLWLKRASAIAFSCKHSRTFAVCNNVVAFISYSIPRFFMYCSRVGGSLCINVSMLQSALFLSLSLFPFIFSLTLFIHSRYLCLLIVGITKWKHSVYTTLLLLTFCVRFVYIYWLLFAIWIFSQNVDDDDGDEFRCSDLRDECEWMFVAVLCVCVYGVWWRWCRRWLGGGMMWDVVFLAYTSSPK